MIFLLFRIMDMKTAQKQLTRETGKCVPYRSQYISDSSMGTGTQHRETFIADQRHRQFILKSIGNLIAVILLNKEPFKMSIFLIFDFYRGKQDNSRKQFRPLVNKAKTG